MKVIFAKEFMESVTENRVISFFKELPATVRSIFRKIINGIQWFAFSWNTYWFDYDYIEKTIVWLLRRMAKRFKSHGVTESAERHAEEMLFTADKLERLTNGIISKEVHEAHEEKFPNKPDLDFAEYVVQNENGHWEYKIPKVMLDYYKTPEGKKERREFLKLQEKIYKIEKKERKEIYGYIAENIIQWWD